mgnify:CR=1 FL=1
MVDRLPSLRLIVLVEDDPLVRALATAVLRRAGYELTVRSDPREALELLYRLKKL